MKDRDPYPKPRTAREAARYLVRNAIAKAQTPEEFRAGGYGIYRPDYNAVVGRVFGANPSREIEPDQIGVIGFDPLHGGEVFAIAELWEEVRSEGDGLPKQATLFES
jgi:hypothetical protein